MIQLEYINKELCSQCQKCCKIYSGNLRKSYFVSQKDANFFESAKQQYGVYPLRNPEVEAGDYCEFHDPSLGCIIERENRPLECRTFVCDDLFQDFLEIQKIYFQGKQKPMIPIGFHLDKDKIIANYEDIDLHDFEKMAKDRISICFSCEELIKKGERFACKKCGCGLMFRAFRVYPLDEEGKAIAQLTPNGSYHYVCPLKKW